MSALAGLSKACVVCGEQYTPRATESRSGWAKRVACSRSCASRFQRAPRGTYTARNLQCRGCSAEVTSRQIEHGYCAHCRVTNPNSGPLANAEVAKFAMSAEARAFIEECRAAGERSMS